MKIKLTAIFSAILLIFAFTGCSKSQRNTEKTLENTQQTTVQTTQQTTTSEVSYENVDATGIYVGQIDNTSVEITIDGTAAAYRYNEDLKPVIQELAKDDKVAFTYYENENKQNILTKIEKVKPSVKEFINIKGTLTGLIDNNSLEIIVDKYDEIEESGGPMAFRIPEELKPYFDSTSKEYKDFGKDEKVVFSFYENENKQLVLTKLEKVE